MERASWIGTAVFAATAIAAAASDATVVRATATVVALVLFAAGTAAFLWAYGIAVGRSRTDAIGIGGLYFLAGETAPRETKQVLLGSLGAQTAIALGTAAARPFTSLAFGILVPMFGLGLTGLWGAKHGRFDPRQVG